MNIGAGTSVLRGRYTLVDDVIEHTQDSQSWVAVDRNDQRFLVRLWPYMGTQPPDLLRALWDAELRNLYRVSSAPGADRTILILKDAGLDRVSTTFVMVLEAEGSGGYRSLDTALSNRAAYKWLRLSDAVNRRELWSSFAGLARGIALLHEQNILHRDIDARHVFLSPDLGVESFRLGGFEWSVRLGVPSTGRPPTAWSSPPEFFGLSSFGYGPETDWFAFGMLLARTFRPIEDLGNKAPLIRYNAVVASIERAAASELTDVEKQLILVLLRQTSGDRLSDPEEIQGLFRDVAEGLDQTHSFEPGAPLIVGFSPSNAGIIERTHALGFKPNPGDPDEPYNPNNLDHVAAMIEFLEDDLQRAAPAPRLSSVRNRDYYILEGQHLLFNIGPFTRTNHVSGKSERSWSVAFAMGPIDLRSLEASIWLNQAKIVFRTVAELNRNYPPARYRSWERCLPRLDERARARSDLTRFYDFIRCTNQIELLVRDSEVFSYEQVGVVKTDGVKSTISVREVDRSRPPLDLFRIEGGLSGFLSREITSGRAGSRQVILTGTDRLFLEESDQGENTWTVDNVLSDDGTVTLSRTSLSTSPPPQAGFLRLLGMVGQMSLIRRRKNAIDRLEQHSYLLRSMSAPGQVYMDTGADSPLDVSIEELDEAKQSAIADILRVRPIYVLQGPPGTGKTTLVTHLLKEIFADDPVAQVLITAQAHGAVDVLRNRVKEDKFFSEAGAYAPLAVRIGTARANPQELGEGSVYNVSRDILASAKRKLLEVDNLSSLQKDWLAAVSQMINLSDEPSKGDFREFQQTVRRGASITYTTTSSGDLEGLADSLQSFDWAIVEEAGQAHAFDLALPLQMGHRWLLIGDHTQLPPYRFEDYKKALERLDDVVRGLYGLSGLRSVLDTDWLRRWSEMSGDEQKSFRAYAVRCLNTFRLFFDQCMNSSGEKKVTQGESVGAASGMLTEQHRMHPAIGTLISDVFYSRSVINRTETDGAPFDRVKHQLKYPEQIAGKAILWVDLPWAQRDRRFEEQGASAKDGRYTNLAEANALVTFIRSLSSSTSICEAKSAAAPPYEIVALSPYARQVGLINRLFGEIEFSGKDLFMPVSEGTGLSRLAFTVDAFQGNQSDIVCASLVRNNTLPPGHGLGFLANPARLNVLLSRAKRLLVIFGSWEFFRNQTKYSVSETDDLYYMKHALDLMQDLPNGWFGRVGVETLLGRSF